MTGPRRGAAARTLLAIGGFLGLGVLVEHTWFVRPQTPLPAPTPLPPGKARPYLLVVVDGLRASSALPGPESAMPFLGELAAQGAWGVARTGEPTLTLGCVRALLTGRSPDPDTANKNFDGDPITGDVVGASIDRGAVAAHAGDAAIAQLLGPRLDRGRVLAYPDRGPRDQGETDDRCVPFALGQVEAGVDVLTVHLVRPDHAGHKHGAAGAEYREACRRTDDHLRALVGAFRGRHPDAVVLVAADHGVTIRGNHGGGEPDAVRAPFVLVGPSVGRVADARIEQTSLAPTVAALLGLAQPPFAESPPETSLTTLPLEERIAAVDEHLALRAHAARHLDRTEAADAAESARRAARASPPSEAVLAGLVEAARALDAHLRPSAAWPVVAGVFALMIAWLAQLAGSGPRTVRARLADAGRIGVGAAAFLVVVAAGLALQHAFDGRASTRHLAIGALALGVGVLGAVAVRARRRVAALVRTHPGLAVLAAGAALGFGLSLRTFVDPIAGGSHLLRDLYAVGGVVAVAALTRRRGGGASPALRWTIRAIAVAVFFGGRVAEHAGGEGWVLRLDVDLSPAAWAWAAVAVLLVVDAWRRRAGNAVAVGAATLSAALAVAHEGGEALAVAGWVGTLAASATALVAAARGGSPPGRLAVRCLVAVALARLLEPTHASAALIAAVCAGAWLCGRLEGPRSRLGIAGLALALVAVRAAAFHASGNSESLSTFDVARAFLPAAFEATASPGTGVTVDVVLAHALAGLRFAVPWIAAFAAVSASLRRRASADVRSALLVDLATAYAGRGAAVVLALSLWHRSAWWIEYAIPVFRFAAAEVVLAAFACLVTADRRARTDGALSAPRTPATDALVAAPAS